MNPILSRRSLASLTTALIASPRLARADTIGHSAKMVLGYGAGSAMDTIARLFAREYTGTYAPNIIVENRTGANGRIAIEAVQHAAPDGETMLMTPESALTIYPHVYPHTLRYDPLKDFVPVLPMAAFGYAFAVGANHPARDLAGFVAWAGTQPDVGYGSPAAGSGLHFLTVQMAKKFDLRMTHVPYRDTGQMLGDLEAGRLPAAMQVAGNVVQLHQTGRVRILAVSTEERLASLPDVPCFAELGYPDMTTLAMYGLLLPAGTPQPIVDGLLAATLAASRKPEVIETMRRLDQAPVTNITTSAGFAARILQEQDRWGPIVRESGFKAES